MEAAGVIPMFIGCWCMTMHVEKQKVHEYRESMYATPTIQGLNYNGSEPVSPLSSSGKSAEALREAQLQSLDSNDGSARLEEPLVPVSEDEPLEP